MTHEQARNSNATARTGHWTFPVPLFAFAMTPARAVCGHKWEASWWEFGKDDCGCKDKKICPDNKWPPPPRITPLNGFGRGGGSAVPGGKEGG